MGQSYRIRTELGVNKTINVELNQDFEFLEILSLTIQQTDVYLRACADYGVVVGRVTANNGFGIPNARVSVFIPIQQVDESNPIISSIYPYKSPNDKNEDGYRYNLLPYEASYTGHAATGTLPSRTDALTGATAVEIYDKYYKFTSKTNESGDYMIMGVPVGNIQFVMDVDLSDIGEFSLTPQDLIRTGKATEAQVAGNRFRKSTDLDSLPQIVNLNKTIEVSPLWGDPDVCQIAINRLDFDLREDASIDIQPTAVFMGSIYSSPDKFRIRGNCKPKDNMGNLCNLTTGPGQIIAIRQTIQQDKDGNPILEQYELEQSGNIIDGSGAWITELPMNLDYVITNEFGEKVLSNDPAIGIPTKAKYRFKVKWQQPQNLSEQTRRGYFLVPNIKEYGWSNDSDPNTSLVTTNQKRQLGSSYYFGLDWTGYTYGFTAQNKIDRLNEIIDCKDTFYEFQFNRVYTVSGLIDQWKKGNNRGRFIGIKEIDNDDCSSTVNKFPTNDGFRNFDFLFFLFSIILTILQPTLLALITVAHILLFLYDLVIKFLCALCGICFFGICPFRWLCKLLNVSCDKKNYTLRLPMITYPDCQACDCNSDYQTSPTNVPQNPNTNAGGVLTYLSLPETYTTSLQEYFSASTDPTTTALITSESLSGVASMATKNNSSLYKFPRSGNYSNKFTISGDLPLGERINIFNSRKSYFEGINKIKVQVEPLLNVGPNKFHYDNTITVLSNTKFNSGDLLTAVNPSVSNDINYLWSSSTINGLVTGISGTPYTSTASTAVTVTYASTQSTSQSVNYTLPYGTDENNYKFPADIEYFQVITAITWNEISKLWNPSTIESFPNTLTANTNVKYYTLPAIQYQTLTFNPVDFIESIGDQYVLILQRGVDPYSPKYIQKYQLGTLFGTSESDPNFTITTTTRLNIPIQVDSSPTLSIQGYNQNEMFFNSYFFKPGISGGTKSGEIFSAYTTTNTGYYGLQDASNYYPVGFQILGKEVISKSFNQFYDLSPSSSKYDQSEDLSGLGGMYLSSSGDYSPPENNRQYYTKTIYGTIPNSAMTISNSTRNVLRTDRLPSSDQLDGGSWSLNPCLLQQNLNFAFYLIDTTTQDLTTQTFTTGADITQNDILGLDNSVKVIESFSCQKMVSLDCYTGFGSSFEIDQNCAVNDSVENGCYVFIRRLILDLPKDWKNLSEWAFRFRFFFGLCRGVLSQSFMNNWVNGSLYAFPIQVDTFYDKQNKPYSKFCDSLIYFDTSTTNFYYRSSPWEGTPNGGKFIGKPTFAYDSPVNKRNLLFPTTIMNLGMKDSFYNEISFEASTNAYVMSELDSTSYGDVSDLINLFVISRITDESFLAQIFAFGDNSLNQLFSRDNFGFGNNNRRIDGDLAQLISINSEIGNIKFSSEYYEIQTGTTNNPTNILGTAGDPVVAVWYSSTTQNLQTKDFLSPGRIDFRATPQSNFSPYPYVLNSQLVPFYKWNLIGGDTIFGTQNNNWMTEKDDIVQKNYQSLDRVSFTTPTYFQSNFNNSTDLQRRGYIFAQDDNGTYLQQGYISRNFIVGAPFHFYFGVIKGESALDKFKTKYSIGE